MPSKMLADGSLPADEIETRLSTEKARKTALSADHARLERLAKVATSTSGGLSAQLVLKVAGSAPGRCLAEGSIRRACFFARSDTR
jgi:hypothetical protein